MSRIRTFIAVDTAEPVRERAVDLANRLRASGTKVSWVKPENMHVTLKFLGDVPDTKIPKVIAAVQAAVAELPAFTMETHGLGAFPNVGRPQTIWLGVRNGLVELTAIYRAIEDALSPLGFAKEGSAFAPHLTLGRVRDPRSSRELTPLLERDVDFTAGESPVTAVLVFASELLPTGPRYELLGRAPLRGED